ncbi:ETX/MTX2 family pore-forming toxin [candidate division KSB1 bacterium]|nr:ETX/MTX2 family pore-forming toxin [candidate division KSB1 bacterium]
MTYSSTNDPSRFRLISDIAWQVADRGTVFNQPNMPPAKLDFAYKATLINCSAATLEESIGRSEQRTTTTTVGTSESLQLFASVARSLDVKVGISVTAEIGIDIKMVAEASVAATVSSEVSIGSQYTTSQTTSSEKTWSGSESITTEVSRIRTLTLPPFTALEAWDAVKTIRNVRVPFTQVLRITATSKDDGSALSGREIQTLMLFNFVGGVVSRVGADFIDISFRGHATIDQMFESTTNVQEIPGACD